MSDIPQAPASRRGRKPLVSFTALVLVAGLASAMPASALAYNIRPDVAEAESVDGQTAVQAAIEADSTVADAAVTALDPAEWPKEGTASFGLGEAEARSFGAPTEDENGVVRLDAVGGEDFEEWTSPLPEHEKEAAAEEADGARNERRLPSEPEVDGDTPATGETSGPEAEEPRDENRPSPQPEEPRPSDGGTEAGEDEPSEEAPQPEPTEETEEPENVEVAGPEPVTAAEVEVLDREEASSLGLSGLALRVTRTDGSDAVGPVRVEVDYADFATAYGADYGSRLSLVALSECEEGAEDTCLASHDLDSANDTEAQTLSAVVPATSSGVLVTAAADGASEEGTGDYTATSLSPSSTWNVGPQTGDFSWNYPMAAPNTAGGLQPDISLSYSSQSVDGRVSDTNNQTSWIGEGFDYHPGYIERRYITCQDDDTETPDQCWSHHNATLNLGGRSTELVYDDGEWTPRNDDGSKVERLTGTTNGDNDGEHWKVTTTDGTQYFFGLNRLPGHSSGDEETDSAWTVPVYGNDSGEPCHKSSDEDAWCQQAWRWNLDYVVDVQGNALSHYYEAETNNYGRHFESEATPYDRGGYLKRTEYGLRDDDPHATAPARVTYSVSERCLPEDGFDCAEDERTEDNAEHWPDTPLDQECESDCAGQHSPTFWTTKKLDTITTQVHDGDEYTTVDTWKLKHTFPEPGDGTDPALWLDSITHTGHVGGTEAYPSITFGGTPMPNRVDSTTDGLAPMNKWRVTAVYTETGGQVDVSYAAPACVEGDTPKPHENTKACFPVIRSHKAGADDITDWFAKYPVSQLTEIDLVGGQPDQITSYDYVGDGAWRYMDDDGFVEEDKRTWSQWRGYERVIVRTGHPDEVRTETEYLFYQGMDGDHLPDGTRSAEVTDSTGTSVTDDPVFNGQTRETIVRDGVDGEVVSRTVTTPWKRETATSSHSWDERGAHMTNTKRTDVYTALADDSFRQTSTVNTFDSYGMVDSVHDQGDVADAGDDRCTSTAYARNTDKHLLSLVSHTRTVAADCEGAPSADEIVSDIRTLYDGQGFGETPTQGRPTETQRATDYGDEGAVYQTVTTSEFDEYGRAVSTTDAEGNTTTTEYTAAHPGGHDVKVETTNALGHVTVEELDARSQPVAEIDADGNRTELAYDPLGRLTDVWLADRKRSLGASPSARFEYHVRKDAPTTVVSHSLNADGDYTTSYQILDGFLRQRQSQAPAPGGGRVITDTFLDSRGNTVIEREPYHNEEDPVGELFVVNNHDEVPRWTRTVYDGADRATDVIQMSRGVEQWRTTTEHHGDRALVTTPEGGTGTTSITDARGNVVELRKHHGEEPVGDYDSTLYTYTARGELETVTDPGGNTWNYTYDLLGRKVSESDPDTGTSTFGYDDLDRLESSTDARGRTLHTTYDALGRKTHLREGSATGSLRASWTYDTVMTGALSSATRHSGGEAYTTKVLGYDELGRPRAQQVVVPASEGALGGTYLFRTLYNPDGSVSSTALPPAGDLPGEPVVYDYDDLGNVTTLTGNDRIITETVYSKVGNLVQREFHRGVLGSDRTWQTFDFDEKTNRLDMASVVPQIGEGSLSTQTYAYDDIGNLLRINDEPTDPQQASDVQCFDYDHLRRLNQVWTPDATGETACAAEPDADNLGGAAPYWHSYTYDATGNRVEEIQYAPGGGQTTRSYSSPEEGQGPAHAVAAVEEQGVGGTTEHSYDYDASGNMVRRTTGERDQVLEWGPEGELASVTEGVDRTEYVYDAGGERLLRRAHGATTLYLPGMEVTWDPAAGTEEATRYFEHAGETVAVRENDGDLHWVFSDHHGTGEMAVDAVWGEVVQRRMTVFGENREAAGDWPGERGFVDGTVDESTGLTQLGARAYDAALGRFVSVDPLLNLADAQSMNGYAYANNSPATYWDGNGLAAWDIQQMKARENYLRNTGYYDSPAPKKKSKNSSSVSITVSITVYPGGGVRTNWTRMNYGPNVTSPYLMSTPTYKAPANYWNGPVKSPKEEAIEDATWLSRAGDAVGGWFSDRYTTDDGMNWWNIAGDAAFAMSFVPGLQWAGFLLGAGVGAAKLLSSSQSNLDGIWDIAGALPFGIGRGARFLARSSIRSNASDFFSYKSSKKKPNSQAVRNRFNGLRGDISSIRYYDSLVQDTAGMIGGAHDFVTGARAVEDPGWSWAA
ncbi:RHS repeat domain-containing protein [Nocardiopsis deserti]|uniref:RHS repeat domain-containing protein n=1 Tax=Nocardiopsis deserti TaxID=2605988 RepID=UPI00123A35F1|nr:RHS repeat-associated core domain-containing protein [Nocardiopsis deserti]